MMANTRGFKQEGSCHYDYSLGEAERGKTGLKMIAGIWVRNGRVSGDCVQTGNQGERLRKYPVSLSPQLLGD